MMAVSYQMAVILEAFAMAHALNRTIIFPKFWCWCDFDWYAVVLDGCAMGGRPGVHGADLYKMPFECPIDVILNPHYLYNRVAGYRQERWLTHRRVPAALSNDREPVLVIDQRDAELQQQRARMVANTYTGAYIPSGTTSEGLHRYLTHWNDTRILDVRNIMPGTFGGFTSARDAQRVDTEAFALFADKKWCCSGEQPMNISHLEWPYHLPQPLSARVQPSGVAVASYAPHPLPHYKQPEFCASIELDMHNAQFLAFDNHPCTYLGMGIRMPATIQELFA